MAYLTDLGTNGQNIVKLLAINFGMAATNDIVNEGSNLLAANYSQAAILNVLFGHATIQGSMPKLGPSYSDTAFVTQLIDNYVGAATVSATDKASLVTKYVADLGTAGKYATRGDFAVALQAAMTPTTAPTAGTAEAIIATSLGNRVEASAFYAQNNSTFVSMTAAKAAVAAVTDVAATLTTATTAAPVVYALTTGTDNKVASSGNDTITAAAGTLTSGDTIDGGAGTDTLNAVLTGTAPTQSATSLKNVEILNITSSPNSSSIDLTGVTGLTEVNNLSSGTTTVTVTNVGNVVNTTITGATAATSVGFATAAVSGTTDAATLTLSTVGTNSTFVTSGIETMTVKSTTAANTLTTLTDTGMTKLVVTGDKDLTITNAVGSSTITTVDATAATGAVTLATGNGPSTSGVTVTGPTAGGAFSITTGSGKDTITMTAGTNTIVPGTGLDTLNLGSGVDTVRFAEAGAANADTINSFSSTDVIQVVLGNAQSTASNGTVTAAAANSTFGTLASGATSPVFSGVNGAGTGTAISFASLAPGGAVTATNNVLGLTAFADGTVGGAITAMGTSATTGITTTPTGKFLLATYSVGNIAQIWAYGGDTTVNTDIDSAELSLVATLNNIAANSLTSANFATYLTPAAAAGATSTTAGSTFTLTAANAIVTPLTSVSATPSGVMSGANDTINASNFTGAFIQDDSTTDADVFNTLVNVALTPTLVNVETVNATLAGNTLTTTNMTGVNTIVVSGAAGTITTGSSTMPTIAMSSGFAAALTVTPAAAGNAHTVRLDGTATGASIVDATATALTINVASSSSLSGGVTTGVGTLTITGSGSLTLGTVGSANLITATAMTGALTATGVASIATNTGSGNDLLTLTTGSAAINLGAGNDTINAAGGTLTTGDTIAGGTGTDTVNVTGAASAVSASDFDNLSSIEAINLAQTTANVAITTVDALVDAGATLTVTANSTTTNTSTLTFNGTAELNGFFNITGGIAADPITGGNNADTITGGGGTDTITGRGGNDSIILSETTAVADKVVFIAGSSATAANQFIANGTDTITGWGSADTLNVAALGDGSTGAADTAITAAAARQAIVDDRSVVISTTGAAANLTTSGTAVVTDWTSTTQVAAYLSERFTSAAGAEQVFVVNNTTSGANTTYVYSFVEDGVANTTFSAIEFALVGVISNGGTALADANVVYA